MLKYSCTHPGCEKKFGKLAYLTLHENTHKGIRPYKCNKCSKAYYKSSHLLSHRRRIHKEGTINDTINNTCSECGKIFSSPESRIRHENICGQIFNCIYCKRVYIRSEWYIRHLRWHESKTPTKNNSKSTKSNPTNPTNQSNPTKPTNQIKKTHLLKNICSVCGKGFRFKKSCKAHEKGAHGEKQYQCMICFSYFSYAHTLRKHIAKIHSEEKEKPSEKDNVC